MGASVAVIVTSFLKDYIGKAISGFPQANEFEIYSYSGHENLLSVYKNLPKTVQGVVVGSSIPARILQLSFPDPDVPIQAFDNDNAGIYKLFLELLNEDRTLDLGRVFADVFDLVRLRPESFLFGSYVENLSDLVQARVSEMSLDELMMAEDIYAAKHLELWRSGQIDISVTRVSLIVDRLRQAGLNVRFAYPDITFVRNVLTSALQEVTIKGLTDNLPCSVLITIRRNTDLTGDNLMHKVDELGKNLGKFCTVMKLSWHTQKREYGYEIFTNHETVAMITENFTGCKLRGFLSGKLDFNFDIGYGIGFGLYQAHVNAMDAVRDAYNLPFAVSCLKNERNELTSPLGRLDLAARLTKESGISHLTIQQIISAVNTLPDGNVTPDELSRILPLTKQSARRFLNVLHKAGLARVVGKKQTASKGRPENVYKLTIN